MAVAASIGAAASIGGSMIQKRSAKKAADKQAKAAAAYAEETKFRPFNINTQNGSVAVDGQNVYSNMSPFANDLRGAFGDLAGFSLNRLGRGYEGPTTNGFRGINQGVYDQYEAANRGPDDQALFANLMSGYGKGAQDWYDQARSMNIDERATDRLGLLRQQAAANENRFFNANLEDQFAKGILASTAGAYQTQGALDSLNQADISRQLAAYGMAGDDFNRLLQASQGSLGNYMGMDQLQYNRASDAFGRAMGMFGMGEDNAFRQQSYEENAGLSGLAAAMGGMGQLDQQQQELIRLAFGGGAAQSGANASAYEPGVQAANTAAQGTAAFGNALGGAFGQLDGAFGQLGDAFGNWLGGAFGNWLGGSGGTPYPQIASTIDPSSGAYRG
jgi:hypothetical protein